MPLCVINRVLIYILPFNTRKVLKISQNFIIYVKLDKKSLRNKIFVIQSKYMFPYIFITNINCLRNCVRISLYNAYISVLEILEKYICLLKLLFHIKKIYMHFLNIIITWEKKLFCFPFIQLILNPHYSLYEYARCFKIITSVLVIIFWANISHNYKVIQEMQPTGFCVIRRWATWITKKTKK